MALNNAQPGDTIRLVPGQSYVAPPGGFVLPVKPTSSLWIVIRSGDLNGLPEGVRVQPSKSPQMAKILSANVEPALQTAPGAARWRIAGVEVTITPSAVPDAPSYTNYQLVMLGNPSATSMDQSATELVLDRCYIHGLPRKNVRRGVSLQSGSTAVIDSDISEIHEIGADNQAICGWNGPGPYKIVNNYLEAAGENFMLGGADPAIPNLLPADVEFRLNHLRKPMSWRVGDPSYAGFEWAVKNLFEIKHGQRWLIEGNVFENNWNHAQAGYAILLRSLNQDGGEPWSVTTDVTFRNNVIRHTANGINLSGTDPYHPSGRMRRIALTNNFWDDIDGNKYGSVGHFLLMADTPDVKVDHNTVVHTGNVAVLYGPPMTGFIFTNNVANNNLYGVIGDGVGQGKPALNTYVPGAVFLANLLAGGNANDYPSGNFFPASFMEVGFVNLTGGDYSIRPDSTYAKSGLGGEALGTDFAKLYAAMGGNLQNVALPRS